ncbi:MAG: alpha/beta hydrolase [Acidimicrobiia bacterium]
MARHARVVILCLLLPALAGAVGSTAPPRDTTAVPPVSVTRDIVYGTVGGERLILDAYVPSAKTTKRPVILLVHGGAWQSGDKSDFTGDGMRLAELGYVAFSLNYRLAPLHPYPAAVDDVKAAVRWVRARAPVKTYALDPKRIGAIGSSAGGHLVGMLATLGSGSLTKGARIKAAVSWSGPMNFSLWPLDALADAPVSIAVLQFLDCIPGAASCANVTAASPISHIDKSDAPMLLVNSEQELVALSQATSMDAALKSTGVVEQLVVLPGTRHAQAFGADLWDRTVAFLEKYVGKPPAPPKK